MNIITEKINLDSLKTSSSKQLNELAKEIRAFLISLSKQKEIHLGSNLGIVELTISLFINFDFYQDKILYDTGHQTYIHKILTNRIDEILKIKEKESSCGLMELNATPFDHYSPGHSGNIISVLSGLYKKNSLNYFVGVIGDAALSNGLAIEGLLDVGFNKQKIIIILNDNQMSISKTVGALSSYLKGLKSNHYSVHNYKNFFNNLGFAYIGKIDGHNIDKVNKAIKKAKSIVKNGPVIVHVKTIKGKGIKEAENNNDNSFHTISLSNKMTFGKVAYQNLNQKLQSDKNIIIINPAMNIGSGFAKMLTDWPNNYFDVGICEEHAISKASGACLANKKVFVLFYSTFLQRSYDQLIHDCARLNLNLTILLDRSDVACSEGNSHHGIFDVGYLKTIPNTTITMPRNFNQLNQLLDWAYHKNNGINIIRYPTAPFINLENEKETNNNFQIQKKVPEFIINNHADYLIITYGPYTDVLKQAIINQNQNIDLINAIWINNLDEAIYQDILKQYKTIVIYERIYSNLGLFAEINEIKNKFNLTCKLIPCNYKNFVGFGQLDVIDRNQKMDFETLKKFFTNH